MVVITSKSHISGCLQTFESPITLRDVVSAPIKEKLQGHVTILKNVIQDSLFTHVLNCTTSILVAAHLNISYKVQRALLLGLLIRTFRAELSVMKCDSSRHVCEVNSFLLHQLRWTEIIAAETNLFMRRCVASQNSTAALLVWSV
jgi:hypothetical protein